MQLYILFFGGEQRNTSVSLILMSGVCHGEIITVRCEESLRICSLNEPLMLLSCYAVNYF